MIVLEIYKEFYLLTDQLTIFDQVQIHFQAWKKGLKSLYYCRSKSIQRAEVVSKSFVESSAEKKETNKTTNYEECLSCQ